MLAIVLEMVPAEFVTYMETPRVEVGVVIPPKATVGKVLLGG